MFVKNQHFLFWEGVTKKSTLYAFDNVDNYGRPLITPSIAQPLESVVNVVSNTCTLLALHLANSVRCRYRRRGGSDEGAQARSV